MAIASVSGADIDAQFRRRGGFSLTNLEGTMIVYYRYNGACQVLPVNRRTPTLVALRNFLVNQARLGS